MIQPNMLKYLIGIVSCYLLLTATGNQLVASERRSQSSDSPHLVEAIVVRPQSIMTTAVYTGSLRAKTIRRIFTQEAGRIVQLPYYEGDQVTANTLLVQLDNALLTTELDKAIAIHQQARINVQRLQKLAQQQLISADELLQAQTEQEIARAEENRLRIRLSYTTIEAPFTGIVTDRLAEPGDVVPQNTHILTLIDPASLIVEIKVSERLLSQLKLLEPVSVRIDALGDKEFSGSLSRIHPTIGPLTRLGKVEVSFNSLPQRARVGQFGRVTITSKTTPQLTVPYSALRRDKISEYVWLIDSQQMAQRQAVRSGLRLADKIAILEGLQTGQTVITKGFFGLQPGRIVQPINDQVTERDD